MNLQLGCFEGNQRFFECKEYIYNDFKNTPILRLESNFSAELDHFNDLMLNTKD